MPEATTDLPELGDFIQPFQIEALGIRGRFVRLGSALEAAIGPHGYPPTVAGLLSQTVTLAAALAGALKFKGIFTLQTQSDGPISVLIADVTSDGSLRAYARFDPERLAAAEADAATAAVPRFLGSGYLAFTVDQGPDTDRYQGITELAGGTLAECAQAYFRQSEQIETAINMAAQAPASGVQPRAAALMVQRLPAKGTTFSHFGEDAEDGGDDGWRRAVILTSSAKGAELLDPAVGPNDLLYRLFHEDGVRVYRPKPLVHACRCSRDKVVTTLGSFPRSDIEGMAEDGRITVTCEFCKTDYHFDEDEMDALFEDAAHGP